MFKKVVVQCLHIETTCSSRNVVPQFQVSFGSGVTVTLNRYGLRVTITPDSIFEMLLSCPLCTREYSGTLVNLYVMLSARKPNPIHSFVVH